MNHWKALLAPLVPMFNSSGRRACAGLAVALALTGCGPEGAEELTSSAEQSPVLGQHEQDVSVVNGYDVTLRSGTYTQGGYLLPQWNAPTSRSQADWIGLFNLSDAANAQDFLGFQYVPLNTSTSGLGDLIRIPKDLATDGTYQVRLLASNHTSTQLAYTSNSASTQPATGFRVQATPTRNCSATSRVEINSAIPTAHLVNLGTNKTTGSLTFTFHPYGTSDRIQVWSTDDKLFYDSGCISNTNDDAAPITVTITGTASKPFTGSQLMVLTLPMCNINQQNRGTVLDWTMGCPP
ncbi:MAG TPA: hypothetical protein VEU33_39560 [Archangium sp.]|nr:hypothetical protein [Archangium sp.]